MTCLGVHQEATAKIAHDLMDFDDDLPSGPMEKSTGSTLGSIVAHWRVQ